MANLGLPQTRQRPGGGSGPEHRPEAMRRMAVLAKLIGVERLCQPAANIVAERDGSEKRHSIASFSLRHGERGRYDAATWMSQRRCMRVVGFVGVSEHAIGQCGVHGGGKNIDANNAGFF